MTVAPIETLPPAQNTAAALAATTAPATSADGTVDNVSENEFLQLLVAQIQNQDPTNPTDSTTFVTQLAQFSALEQLIAIHGDLDSLAQPGNSGTQNIASTQGGKQ